MSATIVGRSLSWGGLMSIIVLSAGARGILREEAAPGFPRPGSLASASDPRRLEKVDDIGAPKTRQRGNDAYRSRAPEHGRRARGRDADDRAQASRARGR